MEFKQSAGNLLHKRRKNRGSCAEKSATITCKAKYGSAKDSITVYCVKKIPKEVKSGFKNPIASIYSSPDPLILKDVCFDFSSLRGPFSQIFLMFAKFGFKILPNALRVTFNQVTVCGKSGSYAYIRYGENDSLDGFVKNSSLKNTGNTFLTLSSTDMNVWADGVAYESRKLTTKYKGDIEWIYDKDSDYFEFDETTGQVIGKVPGKNVTITAKADGETATCTIHLLYKWKKVWTGKTNRKTNLYSAKGNTYTVGESLPIGTEFVVEGDCGTSNGWAYGYYQIGETKFWGYIPISHISTKNTISYYNSLNFVYPIMDSSINYISSPYAKRSDTDLHRGFDITGGGSYIYGENVVAPFNGKVVYVNKSCYNNNKSPSYGYCITIESNGGDDSSTAIKDSVTGKHFAVTYMHLSEAPNYWVGDTVKKGEVIGKIGNTGNVRGSPGVNPIGTHLHFEINNMAVIIGSDLRLDFTYNINPIYFYMNKNFEYDSESDSYKTYGLYWYGPNH